MNKTSIYSKICICNAQNIFLIDSLNCGFALNIALLLYERICPVSRFPQTLLRLIGQLCFLASIQGLLTVGFIHLTTLKIVRIFEEYLKIGIFN